MLSNGSQCRLISRCPAELGQLANSQPPSVDDNKRVQGEQTSSGTPTQRRRAGALTAGSLQTFWRSQPKQQVWDSHVATHSSGVSASGRWQRLDGSFQSSDLYLQHVSTASKGFRGKWNNFHSVKLIVCSVRRKGIIMEMGNDSSFSSCPWSSGVSDASWKPSPGNRISALDSAGAHMPNIWAGGTQPLGWHWWARYLATLWCADGDYRDPPLSLILS